MQHGSRTYLSAPRRHPAPASSTIVVLVVRREASLRIAWSEGIRRYLAPPCHREAHGSEGPISKEWRIFHFPRLRSERPMGAARPELKTRTAFLVVKNTRSCECTGCFERRPSAASPDADATRLPDDASTKTAQSSLSIATFLIVRSPYELQCDSNIIMVSW